MRCSRADCARRYLPRAHLPLDCHRDLPHPPCLKIATGKPVHSRIRMRIMPYPPPAIISQFPVLNWRVPAFTNVRERDLLLTDEGDGEANCVPIPLRRQIGTRMRVAEITEFTDGGIRRSEFLSRGTAGTMPSCAERQPRRMLPGTVVQNLPRHKIGTGQARSPRKLIVT